MANLDSRIKLRHLNCFLEVVRLKSVNKAALTLHVSQPAISKTIAELEEALQIDLFDRRNRNLVLTAHGEIFLRYASASLTSLKQGVQATRHACQNEKVLLRIGALPTVSASILPKALAQFMRQDLNIRPRVITGPNDFILSQLRLGDLDLVIGRMGRPESMMGLAFEHLYSEQVVLVTRPHHPLLARDLFDIRFIGEYEVLLPPPTSIIASAIDAFLLTHGIDPLHLVIETVSNAFGREYTRSTDAVWIISEGVVRADINAGFLARLPIDTSDTKGPVGLTIRSDCEVSLPVQLFAQSVRAAAKAPIFLHHLSQDS